MKRLPTAVMVSVGLMVAACGGGKSEPMTAPPPPPPPPAVEEPPTGTMQEQVPEAPGTSQPEATRPGARHQMDCPMSIPGASVMAEDAPGAVSLVFTAPEPHLNDLRDRVQRMAQKHNENQGQMGPGPQMGAPAGMQAASARYEPTQTGARLVLTPSDGSQLESLRMTVQQHAQQMQQSRGCPTMRGQPTSS